MRQRPEVVLPGLRHCLDAHRQSLARRVDDFVILSSRGRIRLARGRVGCRSTHRRLAGAVELQIGFSLAIGLPTVNGPERSVARASVAAAKRTDTAQASITPCWIQFRLSSKPSLPSSMFSSGALDRASREAEYVRLGLIPPLPKPRCVRSASLHRCET
jgi:hypothetical protein